MKDDWFNSMFLNTVSPDIFTRYFLQPGLVLPQSYTLTDLKYQNDRVLTGLEKLGFVVNKSLCSLKQVQKILCAS